jgi:hypothetical protein
LVRGADIRFSEFRVDWLLYGRPAPRRDQSPPGASRRPLLSRGRKESRPPVDRRRPKRGVPKAVTPGSSLTRYPGMTALISILFSATWYQQSGKDETACNLDPATQCQERWTAPPAMRETDAFPRSRSPGGTDGRHDKTD